MSSPIVGPIAPQNNPPINPQYYLPKAFFITALGYGSTTLVTTSVDLDYVVGQQVKILIPQPYGAQQLNGQVGFVLSIPSSNQVEVGINSTVVDPFVYPSFGNTSPQIIPIGDINSGNFSNTGRVISPLIPGSFINISPV